MGRATIGLMALMSVGLWGCSDGGERASRAGAQVTIDVAPLSLEGVTDATYTLRVVNGAGQELWSRAVSSSAFGDGAGSLSYIGPCDADEPANTVQLVLDELVDASGPLVAGVDFVNPAPSAAPLERVITCLANTDASVTFDLTIARRALQGFFDVAVSFDDLFCSAKLDCRRDSNGDGSITSADEPLRLLHDGATRNTTAVLGFACTGGAGEIGGTVLYRSEVNVTCAGGASATVDPGSGVGGVAHTSVGADPLFAAAVYQGEERLGFDKRYWNVALGLRGGASCVATAKATASSEGLVGATTPAGSPWPVVTWDVNLTDAAGALSCTSHPVGGDSGVATVYMTGERFGASYPALYGTQFHPLRSCLELHQLDPSAVDGLYWVDPLGGSPLQVWCDMSAGGWTLVYRGTMAASTPDSAFTIRTGGVLGTLPVTPSSTGQHKLDDAVINALRSGSVANDLKISIYRGAPLTLLGTSWHRSACVLASGTDHPAGDICNQSTTGGATSTSYLSSGHHGALTRWYVANDIGYIWGFVGIHIGPVAGGTNHGSNVPNPYCTFYDSRACPVDAALEVWAY